MQSLQDVSKHASVIFITFFQPFVDRKRDREILREIVVVVVLLLLFESFHVPINIAVAVRRST